MNQGYSTVKNNKKIYDADYYILGQITEALNPLENIGIERLK